MNLFTRNSPYYHLLKYLLYVLKHPVFISFSSLSCDRSKASSKVSSPHSAIQSFLFQMRLYTYIYIYIYIYIYSYDYLHRKEYALNINLCDSSVNIHKEN